MAEVTPGLAAVLEGLSPGEVRRDEPLAPWSSVRVGGAAEALVRPATAEALVRVVSRAAASGVPVSLLGGGANTLVGDLGVPGVTLKLNADYFPEDHAHDEAGATVVLNAGSAIARVVTVMKQLGLVGAEFLAGIPGTLGGAAAMNAGTKHGECMSIVEALELATPSGLGWVPRAEVPFRYRHTGLPPGSVVTRLKLRLLRGDVAASQARMDADLAYRKRTQPLSQPNFGSVFTNPPGHFAGALIEQVGLKGHRVGGAEFSTLHANWIVNLGGASAHDVTTLMALAQQRVREAHGVELTPEVKRLGRFR